ncbi:hypothetical protein C7416_104485 [Cupriavidus phytorum]|uniref:Uncharacterized protein n=1 Tax=Cupriavidus phytorum TaxID=3024399 RepID=A0A2W7P6B7_9BURK|nr:hypothetical protein [Cupriavidus alkaliphilus]PZX29480.1 hypothetical protein C7416_104485 [Cupriavidus alkaliphilus]
MRILTFGSCLSRYIAESYVDLFGGEVVSSSYHNRIDRFVDTYIKKLRQEIPLSYMESLNLSSDNMMYVKNQYQQATLGKHLLPNGEGFFEAIRHGVDLIITDNFIDLCSRLQLSKEHDGLSVFFNSNGEDAAQEKFEIERSFLPVEQAVQYWDYFGHYLWRVAPNAKRFFVNFPYAHHQNERIARRSKEFPQAFSSKKFEVIPNVEVPARYQLAHTQSHFANDFYAMYAGIVNFRVRGLHMTKPRH